MKGVKGFQKGNTVGKQFNSEIQPENNGRPKKLPALDELLFDVLSKENSDGVSEAKQILLALIKEAKGGNVRASEVMLDRAYGRVKIDVDAKLNAQINIIVDSQDEQIGNELDD